MLDSIGLANHRWDWRWLSYALMSSHLHYAHVAGVTDPDRFYRSAHTRFALRYHRCRGRKTLGPVFAERPTTFHVQTPDVARLIAYHHRNPVDAGVVARAAETRWTSHRAYLRLDPAPPWLDVAFGLRVLGFEDTASGRRAFDQFVMEARFDDLPHDRGPNDRETKGMTRAGPPPVDWCRLILAARAVVGVTPREALCSSRSSIVKVRWLVGAVATRDLGQTCAAVDERLGVRRGHVAQTLVRRAEDDELRVLLAALRRRFANEEDG